MAQANRKSTPPAAKPVAVSFIIDPATAPDRYTLIVQGDCMAPLHRDGAPVIADKRAPYAASDLVVIYIKPTPRSWLATLPAARRTFNTKDVDLAD
jgi:hypothetical protein